MGGASPFAFGNLPPTSTAAAAPTATSTAAAESKAAPTGWGTTTTTASQPPVAAAAAGTTDKAAVNPEFLSHLKALNVQVTEWIRRHIDDNPLVILSPVFKDYEAHLQEITDKFPAPLSAAAVTPEAAAQPFSFGGLAGGKKDEGLVSAGFKVGTGLIWTKTFKYCPALGKITVGTSRGVRRIFLPCQNWACTEI